MNLSEIVRENYEDFVETSWGYTMSDECRKELGASFLAYQIILLEEVIEEVRKHEYTVSETTIYLTNQIEQIKKLIK